MCDDHPHDGHDHGAHHPGRADVALPTVVPVELGAYRGEVIPFEPVEAVRVTVLVDNAVDVLLADQGPARCSNR